MVEHRFVDVPDFLRKVQAYPNVVWIYRGQADASWQLLPKAGRGEYFDPEWETKRSIDPGIPARDLGRFNAWREQAVAYVPSLPQNDFECLAYAQHYGLATRLLDWTSNPLVALYFAVETHTDSTGAVYFYLSWDHIDGSKAALEQFPHVASYRPRPIDRRVLAQAAVFTYHPEPEVPLQPGPPPEEARAIAPDNTDLVWFAVAPEMKRLILLQLDAIGINRKALFPDLEGLSEFTNWGTRRHVWRRARRVEPCDQGEH